MPSSLPEARAATDDPARALSDFGVGPGASRSGSSMTAPPLAGDRFGLGASFKKLRLGYRSKILVKPACSPSLGSYPNRIEDRRGGAPDRCKIRVQHSTAQNLRFQKSISGFKVALDFLAHPSASSDHSRGLRRLVSFALPPRRDRHHEMFSGARRNSLQAHDDGSGGCRIFHPTNACRPTWPGEVARSRSKSGRQGRRAVGHAG